MDSLVDPSEIEALAKKGTKADLATSLDLIFNEFLEGSKQDLGEELKSYFIESAAAEELPSSPVAREELEEEFEEEEGYLEEELGEVSAAPLKEHEVPKTPLKKKLPSLKPLPSEEEEEGGEEEDLYRISTFVSFLKEEGEEEAESSKLAVQEAEFGVEYPEIEEEEGEEVTSEKEPSLEEQLEKEEGETEEFKLPGEGEEESEKAEISRIKASRSEEEKEVVLGVSPSQEKLNKEYEALSEKTYKARHRNQQLNRAIVRLIQEKKINDIPVFGKPLSMEEYKNLLRKVRELNEEIDVKSHQLADTVALMQEENAASDRIFQSLRDKYYKSIWAVSQRALYSQTGKPVSLKVIENFVEKDKRYNSVIREMRRTAIKEEYQLSKAEDYLNSLVDLPDDDAIVEFERTRGELLNYQSLIEAKNIKTKHLERKVLNNTQLISHLREKETYLSSLVDAQRERLIALKNHIDQQLKDLKALNKIKNVVECKLHILQPKMGLLPHKHLLNRYAKMVENRDAFLEQIKDLKQRYFELCPYIRHKCLLKSAREAAQQEEAKMEPIFSLTARILAQLGGSTQEAKPAEQVEEPVA